MSEDFPRVVLGSMCSQRWRLDPKTLLFTLSRYKQVARMLDGCASVAEVGCGDGFAGELVEDVVGQLDRYDVDDRFCAEAGARRWDIAEWALPEKYDAVYSLDVVEHIADADKALRHMAESLEPDGRLIVGMPSLESQRYASAQSRAGHVSCMTGGDLKAMLGRHMRNVFVFCMSDESLTTGFYGMAHYLIGVGCGVRR